MTNKTPSLIIKISKNIDIILEIVLKSELSDDR